MKKLLVLLLIQFIVTFAKAQLPNCAGADSNVVFLHGSTQIYRYDPTQPLSGTNPSVFLSNPNIPWGGLTVSCNLNGGTASPTFYGTDAGIYQYWDGVNWISTGHTAATVNLGGGKNMIYGKNGGTGFISKYVGTGNDFFFVNGHANSGPYDLVTDAVDNLFEVDISTALGKIYKYNTAGVIIDTFYLTGVTPQTAGPGFALIGNKVYLGVNTTPGLYAGTLINDTAAMVGVGNFGLSYGDFASCATANCGFATASLIYPTCLGNQVINISSPLLTGTPTFLWNFGDPASGINNTSTIGNTTHTFSGPGTYNITLIIYNGTQTDTILNTVTIMGFVQVSETVAVCEPASYQGHSVSGVYVDSAINVHGCDSIHILNLTVNPIKYTTINQTVCYGQTYLGYSASGTYVDVLTSAAGCDSVRTLNLVVLPEIKTTINKDICSNENFEGYNQTGTYTDIFVSSQLGCDSIRIINLTVHPNPVLQVSFSDTAICKDDFVLLQASGALTYNWYLNSSSIPAGTGDTYNLQVSDHEYVLVEGFSDFGCRDFKINTFNYIPCCGHVFVPNVFSPNGDQLNDLFHIQVDRDLENYMLQIYDRWGNELFRSIDVNEGWNGKYKGNDCDLGTYQYIIYLKCKENKILKGDFMLVR